MTQEHKQLLLKDLCARLPYGVKVLDNSHKDYGVSKPINIGVDGSILIDNEINNIQYYPIIDEVKPYLRPMSSMTEEEEKEFNDQMYKAKQYSDDKSYNVYEVTSLNIDWLNAHHFDYRGLIPMGLALSALEGMYKKE